MKIPRWKRLLDVTIIVVTAPLWLPVSFLIGIWIKISSRGPVFFKQERVGYLGRPFTMWKFRSMAEGASHQCHEDHWETLIEGDLPMTKLDASDSRLIPGARLLRALGLDELPQLINILRGEMSFVGPRPSTVREFEQCDEVARRRADVLPGITGFWQVNGKNRLTFREMIAWDLAYQSAMSPLTDLRVLVETIPAMISQWNDSRKEVISSGGTTARL